MPEKGKYSILFATHLVPYFALDNECQNYNLQDNLDQLDYSQFSETVLVDTNGRTGTPLPENYSYDKEFEDVEKGELEPEDAEKLVGRGDSFYLIGGRPEICMSNSYNSLVQAARALDEDMDFQILTPYCFTGPGEATLEDELTKDKLDTELVTGLLSSYNFENTSLVSENPDVNDIDNYLRQTQRLYRAQEVLNRENYNAQFRTDADRFQNYGSDQIHFKLDGGRLPSGAINGVEHHLGITNIFEELEEPELDYRLEITPKLELNEEFKLSSASQSPQLEEVRQILSEKANIPLKDDSELQKNTKRSALNT